MNPEDRLRDAAHAYTEQIEPGNDGWARIHEGIAAKRVLRTRRTWQFSLAGATAAIALVLVVALVANNSGGSSTPPVAAGSKNEPQRVIALREDGSVVVMSAASGAVERTVLAAGTPGTEGELPVLSSDGRTLYYNEPHKNPPCDDSNIAAQVEPAVVALDLTATNAKASAPITKGTVQLVSPDGHWIAVSRRATCSSFTEVVHNLRTGADRALDTVDGQAAGWSRDSKLLEMSSDSGYSTYDAASGHLVAGPVRGSGPVIPVLGGGVLSSTSSAAGTSFTYAEVLSASSGSRLTGNTIKSLGTYPFLPSTAALDHAGSHLLLVGLTLSEYRNNTETANLHGLPLYAASDGKVRKIADGPFRWAQWLPDNVALPDTTNPTTPATTATSTPATTATTRPQDKSVVLAVTGCPATFGTSTAPKPVVPTTVRVTISSADANALSGYSDGARTTLLAPKGWQCRGSVGANGSSAFSAAQTLTDNGAGLSTVTGTSVTVATTGTANGTAELLCDYFDIAKSKYQAITPSAQCPGLPAGVTITNRTDTVVRFRGTGSNGNVVMGAARLTPVHDAANPGEWGTGEVVRCELPVTDFHFCSTIVDTWLTIKQPKVG